MKELNILLSCGYGMSTSMLANKMNKYVKEHNYPFTINALPETEALNTIEKFNVVLLSPSVKYLKSKFEKVINGRIPVYIMESRDYGMLNVEHIIDNMLEEMKLDGFYD